jgi:6,7-dimethyl-8-ribityllumazine synthase
MTNLAIVVSEFNYDITGVMLKRAEEHAKLLGAKVVQVDAVPGAYDIPFMVKKSLARKGVDAVVALGAIIEGDTSHDDVIASQLARKLMDLSIESGKPVGLGVSGPGQTHAQAVQRIDDYAKRGVETAVKLAKKI